MNLKMEFERKSNMVLLSAEPLNVGPSEMSLPEFIRREEFERVLRHSDLLNRVLAVVLLRHGGRLEMTERELQALSPDVLVIQEPRRNSGSVVLRLYEERGCPHCD